MRIPVSQEKGEVFNDDLTRALARARRQFPNNNKLREAFYGVQKHISDVVKRCSDNVMVAIYIEDVLEEPIVISSGAMEKNLVIRIDKDGIASFKWTKRTWKKKLKAKFGNIDSKDVKSLAKNIVQILASKATLITMAEVVVPALAACL